MNELTQQRFRPLIEKRLAAIQEQMLMHRPVAGSNDPAGESAEKELRDEERRLQSALQRLATGVYGRCIRCGRDLPVKRLEREPAALTCDPCPPRSGRPARPERRRTTVA